MFKALLAAATFCLVFGAPAHAQNFTTAAEVRPILDATKANWIAVREWDGQDLVYFTHLESWRCGLEQVVFVVNGGDVQPWVMDPCFEGTAQPNAIGADRLPYATFPLGSVQRVDVMVVYDDGSADSATFERAAVLMP